MRFSLFTHNLLYHKAFAELNKLLKAEEPDVVCLQEFEADEQSMRGLAESGYLLAGSSNTFVRNHKAFCVATFYKRSVFSQVRSESIKLPRTHYETFLFYLRGAHTPRSVLRTTFTLQNDTEIVVYNLHLTAYALNGGRIRQLNSALSDLESGVDRAIFAGDFNYPYNRKKLEELMSKYKLHEATKNISHTFESKLFKLITLRLKDDYILYRGIKMTRTKRINWRVSDHYPIISYFEI